MLYLWANSDGESYRRRGKDLYMSIADSFRHLARRYQCLRSCHPPLQDDLRTLGSRQKYVSPLDRGTYLPYFGFFLTVVRLDTPKGSGFPRKLQDFDNIDERNIDIDSDSSQKKIPVRDER
jgi:hypothetical protein